MNWVPSVKEATMLVWTGESTLVPEIDSEHGRQGQRRQPGTLMNWFPPVSKSEPTNSLAHRLSAEKRHHGEGNGDPESAIFYKRLDASWQQESNDKWVV